MYREVTGEVTAKIVAFLLLIISLSFLSLFINSRDFSKTGFEGFIGEGFQEENGPERGEISAYTSLNYDQQIVIGKGRESGGGWGTEGGKSSSGGFLGGGGFSNLNQPFNPPNVPIFFVEGLDNYTNYLRLYTSSEYRGGVWIPDKLSCGISSTPGKRSYKVTPIVNLTEYIPVAKDTRAIVPPLFDCFDLDKGIYSVKSVKRSYFGFSSADKIAPNKIAEKWSELGDRETRELAEKITENASSDFEKVKAIETYLKENYVNEYVEPAKGEDPVKHFLFESKKGTCREFASAFVLLARSLGIPSRVVFGYLADPTPLNQTVYAADAYVWAEVKFDNGWVEFDPTPGGELIETETAITYVDEKILAGREFRVKGYVTDLNKNPVSGFVEIYLKKNKKSEKGILAGILYCKDGMFEGNLTAPNTTGEYSVVAHYTGSFVYNESWSDPRVRIFEEPEFVVRLPDRIPTEFLLRGELKTIQPYTGKILLCTDDSCSQIYVRNGIFIGRIGLEAGNHTISLHFAGENYTLPASFSKEVEVCRVEMTVNQSLREDEMLSGNLIFCDEPYSGSLIVNNATAEVKNGNFTVDPASANLKLGKNLVDFYIPEFGYEKQGEIYLKRDVVIEDAIHGGKLAVHVRDRYANPADGYVEFNGKRKVLINGYAEFTLPDDFERGIVRYSGSERYFPAEKKVKQEFTLFPLLLLLLPGPVAAYYIYRRYGKGKVSGEDYGNGIHVEVVKEHPDLPNVWEVNEIVRLRVRCDGHATIKLNGLMLREIRDEGEVEIKFDTHGRRKILVESGKMRKKQREVEIKISPYSEGIIEVFKLFVKDARKKGIDVESMTAREILKSLNVNKGSQLLQYFELSKYRGDSFDREDFLNAFYEYLKLKERI